jgi:hypothetical protein
MTTTAPLVDALQLFRFAEAAIAGMRLKGKEPSYVRVHPADWDVMVAYARKIERIPRHRKPDLRLYGVPVRLSEEQERGDIRSFVEMI